MFRGTRRHALSNPYFSHSKRRIPRTMIIIIDLLIPIFLMGIGYFSPLLAVTTIKISSVTQVPEDLVREAVSAELSRWSRLPWVSTPPIEKKLIDRFNFKTVNIQKKYLHTLVVSVTERTPHAEWRSADRRFLIDQTGSKIRELSVAEEIPSTLPIIFDDSLAETNQDQIITENRLNSILQLPATIEKILNFSPVAFHLASASSSSIKIVTSEGWQIYLDLDQNLASQLNKCVAVLSKVGDKRNKLQYIDVRFLDRVYYK